MILTEEEFKCPKHGRRPQNEGWAIVEGPDGEMYIPYYSLIHVNCGLEGQYVCRGGISGVCRVRGKFCEFHQCRIDD